MSGSGLPRRISGKYHDILMESVAEISEEFMERYFAGEEFSVAEVSAALKMNISDGSNYSSVHGFYRKCTGCCKPA